jgi:hypothetical protein
VTDLRTLAQAVDDADPEDYTDALEALDAALGVSGCLPLGRPAARAILAALDAADAQGYARAMGEVVERCDAEAGAFGTGRASDHYARALDDTADWADARLLAAAKRD